MQITEDDEQRIFHFECSGAGARLGALQADIVASKRRSGAAEVVFRKDAPLIDDDIAAMSSAMRTANTLIKPVTHCFYQACARILGRNCDMSSTRTHR